MTAAQKGFFVVIGLTIIAGVFLLSQSSIVQAAKKEGTRFEDWVVNCTPKENNSDTPQTCFLSQQIDLNQDDKKQILAIYQIGYFGDKKDLKIIQTLPLGVSIEAGTSIVASQDLVAKGRYTTCISSGCQAVANISADDLKKILTSKETSVAFMNADGKQINMPISSKGLEKGLAYLRK